MSEVKQPIEEPYILAEQLRAFHYGRFQDLIGQLCTLVDASIQNERQVKAMKDIVKQILWEEIDKLSRADEKIMFHFSRCPEPKRIMSDWLEKHVEKELEVT